jgi:hypothetical protein
VTTKRALVAGLMGAALLVSQVGMVGTALAEPVTGDGPVANDCRAIQQDYQQNTARLGDRSLSPSERAKIQHQIADDLEVWGAGCQSDYGAIGLGAAKPATNAQPGQGTLTH